MKLNKFTCLKKILVCLTLFVAVPGVVLFSAGKETRKNVVIKGATVTSIKGVLRSWKDVNTIPLDKRDAPRTLRPVLNFKNPLPIVKKETRPDTAVQNFLGREEKGLSRTLRLADMIVDFPGLDRAGWGSGWPPDPTGDVGVNYFIQAVNTSFGIYNKTDGTPVYRTTFDDFFSLLPPPCGNYNNGDPIVLYDRYNSRWVIMDFAWYPSETQGSWFSIAASQTADPTGNWWLYALQADRTLMNDYPKMGVWHDAIYMTANMFIFPTQGGTFQGVRVWALKIPELYNGTLTYQTVYDDQDIAWTILPGHAKGPTPPSGDTPALMISTDASEYGSPHQDQVVIWQYDVDWDTPGNSTWSIVTQLPVTPYGLTIAEIPQPGTAQTLDSLYGRAMFPAIYRVFDDYEAMYVNHVCEYGGRRTVRWYEVRIADGTPSIYQQSTYAPDSHHRWTGSMAADEDGNIALGFSISSTSVYPSIKYAARASIDPNLNVLSLGEGMIKEGTGYQSFYRWGDYSTMTIDPVDDQTFWYTNEYYINSGLNWQTHIGAFKLKPDLWSRDSPEDTGEEPNTTTVDFWLSEDMWVRNQADGFTNQEHQNPEYGQTNYLYVKVRCREGEGSGRVKTYWSYAGTGMWWPDSWELIGTQYTDTIQNGSYEILEFPWDPPDPSAYGTLPFCLWSRIETAPDSPFGMAFPEIPSFWDNVVNNNNIIWKNFTIVDNIPNGGSGEASIFVANPTKENAEIKLEFLSPSLAETAKTSARKTLAKTTAEKTVLQWGTVNVDLGSTLYNKWQNSKDTGTGVSVNNLRASTVTVTNKSAVIREMTLGAKEKHLIKVIFTPFEKSADDKNQYVFDVIQYHFDGKEFKKTGGVRFIVKPPVNSLKN